MRFFLKSKKPVGNQTCAASLSMPFSRSINLWAVGQLAPSPLPGEMAIPLWPSVIVASQMLLEMNLPRQYVGMTYLFPSMWRNVLAVTVLMMCNFSQPFWWLGLSIGPSAILQESLLMPVDLGLGILVGILCLHTPLILNQTTAATTKIKGSYYMNYMIGRKLSFFKACS